MLAVLLAALFSGLLLRGMIPQLRLRLLDQPNARSSHRQPTPRGGGVAFVAVTSISSVMVLISGQGFPIAALALLAGPLAVVGLLDDRHNLPASLRYGAQLFTAALVLGCSPLVQRFVFSVVSADWLLLLVLVKIAVTAVALRQFHGRSWRPSGRLYGCSYSCPLFRTHCALAPVGFGGFFTWLFALELESRQSVYGGCGQYLPWCGVRRLSAPGFQLA